MPELTVYRAARSLPLRQEVGALRGPPVHLLLHTSTWRSKAALQKAAR
jgi:hypothetical protein